MIDPPVYRRLIPSLYRLEGIRCGACGRADLGRRTTCSYCASHAVTPCRITGAGRILALTWLTKPVADHARLGGYHLALVALYEGPTVLAKLADVRSRPPQVGAEVEVVFRRLYEPDASGLICYGYKFRQLWHSIGNEAGNTSSVE